jgi:hypothetical protein
LKLSAASCGECARYRIQPFQMEMLNIDIWIPLMLCRYRSLADTAVSLSGQHDGGYLMVSVVR